MATSSGQGARPPPSQPTRGTPGQRFDEPGQVGPKQAAGKLGDYRIVRTLGEGSFGKVRCMTPSLFPRQILFVLLFWEELLMEWVVAEHQKTKQLVALKFIDRAKLSRDTNDRVEREIQYLKLLRHPHIIKLYVLNRNPD